MYVYIHICMYICMYMYIYIYTISRNCGRLPGGLSPWALCATEAGRNKKTAGCQDPSLIHCFVLAGWCLSKD